MTKEEAWKLLNQMEPLATAVLVLEPKGTVERYFGVEHEEDGRTVGVFVVVGESRVKHIKGILEDPFAGSVMQAMYDDGNGGLSAMKIVPPRPKPQDFDFDEDKWVEALFAWRDSL